MVMNNGENDDAGCIQMQKVWMHVESDLFAVVKDFPPTKCCVFCQSYARSAMQCHLRVLKSNLVENLDQNFFGTKFEDQILWPNRPTPRPNVQICQHPFTPNLWT